MRLVSGYYSDTGPFHLYPGIEDMIATSNPADLKKGDILVIWGGEDISPTLYNKPVGRWTGASERVSRRDGIEWSLMQEAVKQDLPIVGVCRGAQMLCALAGGHLLQHVTHHGGYHVVETPTGYEFTTNSIHHQMMYPYDVEHEMLASIKPPRGEHWDVDTQVELEEEPEFVYFPKVKGFAIQWHPEAMDDDCAATKYIFQQMLERL
jgi:gamma-glutamyl-gamma-aminobutyrate hydrolase PuuD